MLDTTLKTQLQGYLERLVDPIELVLAIDGSAKSQELRELVDEIATLNGRISVHEERDEMGALQPAVPRGVPSVAASSDAPAVRTPNVRTPSFAVARTGEAPRVRFAGLPLGHEFTSLVLALLQVSGYPPKVEANLIEQIRALPAGLEFEVYVSLTCHNCPDVVQALNLMATVNPGIHATMIDGALFQGEVNARQVMAVPSVFLNGQPFGQGRMTLEEILAKVDTGAAERAAEELSAGEDFDMLVVGGGPAGAAAAIYAARKGIRTGVLAERFGGQVLDTLSIENFISVTATEGPQMAQALEQHVKTYDVDIMNNQRAEKIVRDEAGSRFEVHTASGAVVRSKTLVLATGARWREMNVPGEKEYRGRGVAYCPHCDGPLFKGKRVAVVGGGNSGVEAAIDLAGIVAQVTLIEFDGKLRADAVLQQKLASLPNVTVVVSAQTTEVHGDGQKVNALSYQDRGSGELRRVDLEGVFVQIGLLPNTDWLKGSLDLTPRGEIEVDARGQTSLPGVFAAGDATTVPYKQIIIAMGEGAKAALGAFDHLIRSSVPGVAAGKSAAAA